MGRAPEPGTGARADAGRWRSAVGLVLAMMFGCEAFPDRPTCGAETPCPPGFACGADGRCAASADGGPGGDAGPGGGSGDARIRDAAREVDVGSPEDAAASDSGRPIEVDAAIRPDGGGTEADACVARDEVCNGIDDDCDGPVDEHAAQVGTPCPTGAPGICADGSLVCTLGGLDCVADQAPRDEQCDGADEDCDGAVDEDAEGACAPCDTGEAGHCALGSSVCLDGVMECRRHRAEIASACNLVDDDCDGTVDEAAEAVGDAVRSDPLAVEQCGERGDDPLAPSPGEPVPGACADPGRVGCGPIHACLDAGCLRDCGAARDAAAEACAVECIDDPTCTHRCASDALDGWRACAEGCPGAARDALAYTCGGGPTCQPVECVPGAFLRDGRCVRPEVCNNGIDEDGDGLVDGTIDGPDPCAGTIAASGPARVGACPAELEGTPDGQDCPAFTKREEDQCAAGACPKRVRLSYDYALDREEVSFRAYLRCVDEGCCPPATGTAAAMARRVRDDGLSPERPGEPTRCMPATLIDPDVPDPVVLDLPASGVTWCGARDFCAWAGKRLATEAEFEIAAVGGDPQRRFPWGDNELAECAPELCCVEAGFQGPLPEPCTAPHVFECPQEARPEDGARTACLATFAQDQQSCFDRYGSYAPRVVPSPSPVWSNEDGASDAGVLNLLGNVSEWTFDWASPNWGAQPDVDPVGPACSTVVPPSRRVTRGGTLFRSGDTTRSHRREFVTPGTRLPTVGFRCARTLDPGPEDAPRLCDPGLLGSIAPPGDACRARLQGRPACRAPDLESLHGIGACAGAARVPSLSCTENVPDYCAETEAGCDALVIRRLNLDEDRLRNIIAALALTDETIAELNDALVDVDGEASQANATFLNNDMASLGGTSILALDLPCGFGPPGRYQARLFNGAVASDPPRLHALGVREDGRCEDLSSAPVALSVDERDLVTGFCEFTEMDFKIRGTDTSVPFSAIAGYLGQIRRDPETAAPTRLEMGLILALTERDARRSAIGDLRGNGVGAFFEERNFQPFDLCFFQSLAQGLRANQDALAFIGGWACGAFETWPGCVEGRCIGEAEGDGENDTSMCTGWAIPLSMEAVPIGDAGLGVEPCDVCVDRID